MLRAVAEPPLLASDRNRQLPSLVFTFPADPENSARENGFYREKSFLVI
jgi:hypothetical protein